MHILSNMILVVEAQNAHVYSVSFVVSLWIKIGRNESGWFSVFTFFYSTVLNLYQYGPYQPFQRP